MTTLRNAVLALALTSAAATAHAGVKASAVTSTNWAQFSPAEVFVPLNDAGATTLTFKLSSAGKKILTYSAACAVGGQAGITTGYVHLDIYVNGVVIAPTGGNSDTFCTADGTTSTVDGAVRASITVPIQGISGNNTIQIKATGNYGATGFLLGHSALVIYD